MEPLSPIHGCCYFVLNCFCCCNSYPDSNPCDGMLDQLFHEKSRNRSLPCVQVNSELHL